MVDGRAGPSASDQHIIEITRKYSNKIWFVVNKTEGLDSDIAVSEFQNFGFSRTAAISASHGDQVSSMMDEVLKPFVDEADFQDIDSPHNDENKSLSIAIIGRPNVGKSTLINRLIGEDRLVVYDQPGTTRDTIKIDIQKMTKTLLSLIQQGFGESQSKAKILRSSVSSSRCMLLRNAMSCSLSLMLQRA